jgi:DNA adenine methylase
MINSKTRPLKRPAFRYHGGKWLLAPWIISHFPQHRIYTEVFGGAASVLLRKNRVYSEVYNDLNDEVVAVFRVLRDPESAKELERVIRLTPYSKSEFLETYNKADFSDIERARRLIFRSFSGFGSASMISGHNTGFRGHSHMSGTTPAKDWANYPNIIKSLTDRLIGVTIHNDDYWNILQKNDSPQTLHYVDPPYVHETRFSSKRNVYAIEMTNDDHAQLSERLHSLKGMVVLSGYNNSIYQYLFKDWKRIDKKAFADGAKERVESLWLNDLCYSKLNLLF